MIKILTIGNSFSQDVTALVELLSPDIFVRNLYIGGCSLERHYKNIINDAEEYEYQQNGGSIDKNLISIKQALLKEKWDYITVQQASCYSGLIESYYPYIGKLIKYIKKYSDAEIIFHEVWAYEKGYVRDEFEKYYDNDQQKMQQMIKYCCDTVCEKEKIRAIRTGETIAKLREYDFFDIDKNISISRDGFHLNLAYGRIAGACTFIKFFTGKMPEYLKRDDLAEGYKIIKKVIFES